jgi:hypothetical protein
MELEFKGMEKRQVLSVIALGNYFLFGSSEIAYRARA